MQQKGIYLLLLALAGFLPANAQYKFTIDGGFSGDCAKVSGVRELNQQLQQIKGQVVSGFPDPSSCENARAIINSIKAQAEMIVYDARTGKTIDRKKYNCHFKLNASPCTGRPLGGTNVGTPNVLGVSQGTSFYSTNTANEIQNWSEDEMERMLALNLDVNNYVPTKINTGDSDFDNSRNDYVFSGKMPEGSTSLIKGNNQITSIGRPSRSGVLVPDDFFSKPFNNSLGDYSSSDLNSVNINLEPIAPVSGEENVQTNRFMDAVKSVDEHLDWYNALNQGGGNVFQYMYTRWGKENVMAGADWWERNQVGDRISNAITSVKEIVINTIDHPIDTYDDIRNKTLDKMKENIDGGIISTIQFMLPPQYEKTGKRVQAIYDTEKGTITDVFEIVKNAPDMISKGETFDMVATLEKEKDKYMGLAASYGSPTTINAYSHLKSASDIYNMPKEKQSKGLFKLLGKESMKGAKTLFKESKYGKKWDKIKTKAKSEAKSVIDPYKIIFD